MHGRSKFAPHSPARGRARTIVLTDNRRLCRICQMVWTDSPDGVCRYRSEWEDRVLGQERRRSA